jgi:RND superfamily putative drug exporter
MDTFLVRTLLVPSTVVLLGRWNWWPSPMSRKDAEIAAVAERAASNGSVGPSQDVRREAETPR